MPPATPEAQTLLAFDYGKRRVGVAIGNTVSGTAQPLVTLSWRSVDQLFQSIQGLIDQWQPNCLVVGRPLTEAGASQEMTQLAERFARRLHGRFGLAVTLVDERFSSLQAADDARQARLLGLRPPGAGQDEPDDAIAAAIILRQYLDDGSNS